MVNFSLGHFSSDWNGCLGALGTWVGYQSSLGCEKKTGSLHWRYGCWINVDVRKQDSYFVWVHLPLLQPLQLTWGVSVCRGEAPFPVSICSEELTNGFHFLLVIFHSIPVPIITFHTCLTPFLLWPPSTLQANSYYYCPLISDGKAESYRIKAVIVGGEVRFQTPQPVPNPVQDQRGHPTPKRRWLWPLKLSSRRRGPGESYQHLFLEASLEPY